MKLYSHKKISTTHELYEYWVWEKKGAHLFVLGVILIGSPRYSSYSYLKNGWPYTSGLSAMNAIGTYLCDLKTLTVWADTTAESRMM